MNNLKELKIWKKAIDLAVEVYEATSHFPTDELIQLDELQKMNYGFQQMLLKKSSIK